MLQDVGVLLVTRKRWGGCTTHFLDLADIHSVFIHEVLTAVAAYLLSVWVPCALIAMAKLAAFALAWWHHSVVALLGMYRQRGRPPEAQLGADGQHWCLSVPCTC